MRKIFSFIVVCAVALSISFSADAQVKFGIKGGLNLTNLTGDVKQDVKDVFSTYTGFHGGVALNIGLPLGFALQPEVLYTQKGTSLKMDVLGKSLTSNIISGAVQVPVGVQWGFKLGPVRPFVQAVPYISFPVSYSLKTSFDGDTDREKLESDNFQSFDYGAGLGVGIDIWKLQVSAKYNWSFGTWTKESGETASDIMDNVSKENAKISGFEISLGIFF